MFIYRYEDRNHVGPFAHIGFNRRFAQLDTAQEVGLQWHIGQSASACIDINSLLAYFGSRSCDDMEDVGYRIAQYRVNVEDVQIGSNQVVFNRNRAVLIQFI